MRTVPSARPTAGPARSGRSGTRRSSRCSAAPPPSAGTRSAGILL